MRAGHPTLAFALALTMSGHADAGAAPVPTTEADRRTVVVTVHLDRPMHRIDPAIYGASFATAQELRDLNLPLNRSGGNSATLYNWRIDARSAGADWFFESLPIGPGILDQFNSGFVATTRAGGAAAMITIPMIGWTARLGPARRPLAGFSIAKYGPQLAADTRFFADAGNGVRPGGAPVSGNDPRDAAEPVGLADAAARVTGLVARWGQARKDGARYYIVDNEPSLWHVTHRAVHPVGAHAQEVAQGVIATARAIHQADPGALVVAPEEWGWPGYLASGFDQQAAAKHLPGGQFDRATQTGGIDYLPYLLRTWRAAGHPVDVVSVHFYPQGGEYPETGAGSRALQLLRNRSTRLLWDVGYREEGWIATEVALIPRLRHWVDANYRTGTPIAITEYNWGGERSMSGAVAQADLWGIFGREGLNLAARWRVPPPGSPTYLAMRLIRNYDGHDGAFGDVALQTEAPVPDSLSAFAASRSGDRAVTVLAINKSLDAPAHLRVVLVGGGASRRAQVVTFRLVAGTLSGPVAARLDRGAFETELPAQSIALFEVSDHDG